MCRIKRRFNDVSLNHFDAKDLPVHSSSSVMSPDVHTPQSPAYPVANFSQVHRVCVLFQTSVALLRSKLTVSGVVNSYKFLIILCVVASMPFETSLMRCANLVLNELAGLITPLKKFGDPTDPREWSFFISVR